MACHWYYKFWNLCTWKLIFFLFINHDIFPSVACLWQGDEVHFYKKMEIQYDDVIKINICIRMFTCIYSWIHLRLNVYLESFLRFFFLIKLCFIFDINFIRFASSIGKHELCLSCSGKYAALHFRIALRQYLRWKIIKLFLHIPVSFNQRCHLPCLYKCYVNRHSMQKVKEMSDKNLVKLTNSD